MKITSFAMTASPTIAIIVVMAEINEDDIIQPPKQTAWWL